MLLNSSENYQFAKDTSIFDFYLVNPSPALSLDNYSLFPSGGGRKGFPLETQLASAIRETARVLPLIKSHRQYTLSLEGKKKKAKKAYLDEHA